MQTWIVEDYGNFAAGRTGIVVLLLFKILEEDDGAVGELCDTASKVKHSFLAEAFFVLILSRHVPEVTSHLHFLTLQSRASRSRFFMTNVTSQVLIS